MVRPHIVILGAGFGGTYTAKKFSGLVKSGKADVTIVNRTNYFLFTPLLHEVATGSLSPRSVAEPLREIFAGRGIRIIQGTVESIDLGLRKLSVKADGRVHDIAYDYLVISTGAETNYYDIPGAAEHTLPLKSLSDAAQVRNRIIDSFEQAILAADEAERRALLSFAVVGGGPTGVELAAELAEFTKGIARRYYDGEHCRPGDAQPCEPEEVAITLVNAGKELLEQFDPSLRAAAQGRLAKNGVKVENGVKVTKVTPKGLETADGKAIPAATVIWTAGVKAIIPHFDGMAPTLTGGRLAVDNHFRLLGNERVFVLGDAAAYVDAHEFKADSAKVRPLPMLAQVAEAEAGIVAWNIAATIGEKPLRDLHYRSQGSMVSVGQWFAIGEIFSMRIHGHLAWWLWRTVYLFKFASWRKRVRIGFEWAFELISPRDITKL